MSFCGWGINVHLCGKMHIHLGEIYLMHFNAIVALPLEIALCIAAPQFQASCHMGHRHGGLATWGGDLAWERKEGWQG